MSGSTKTQGKYRPREALPEGPLPDRSRKLAGAAIAEHRIYAEAAAGAGRGHVTATYQKPSAFFRAYEIGGETRSALLSMQSKPENAVCRPKKHPDRRTAEGDKPSKRKPDKHVVSVHGRLCQMMLVQPRSAILGSTNAITSSKSCYCTPVICVFASHSSWWGPRRMTLSRCDRRLTSDSCLISSKIGDRTLHRFV